MDDTLQTLKKRFPNVPEDVLSQVFAFQSDEAAYTEKLVHLQELNDTLELSPEERKEAVQAMENTTAEWERKITGQERQDQEDASDDQDDRKLKSIEEQISN